MLLRFGRWEHGKVGVVRKGRIPEKYPFKGFSGVSRLIKTGELLGEIVGEHGRMKEGKKVFLSETTIACLRGEDKKGGRSDKMEVRRGLSYKSWKRKFKAGDRYQGHPWSHKQENTTAVKARSPLGRKISVGASRLAMQLGRKPPFISVTLPSLLRHGRRALILRMPSGKELGNYIYRCTVTTLVLH